jgi:hypothetical protein
LLIPHGHRSLSNVINLDRVIILDVRLIERRSLSQDLSFIFQSLDLTFQILNSRLEKCDFDIFSLESSLPLSFGSLSSALELLELSLLTLDPGLHGFKMEKELLFHRDVVPNLCFILDHLLFVTIARSLGLGRNRVVLF